MPTSAFTIANKAVLNKTLRYEAWFKTFWSRFAGFASKNQATGWSLTGNPIDVFTDIKEKGRNSILVPMLRPLYDYPKLGKQQLKGDTEEPRFLWHKVFVHLARHGVDLPDLVDQQKINWAATYKEYLPALRDWWARWENSEVTRAFLEGFSYNITDSTYGLGKTKRYNKNMWIWDGGNNEFTTNAATFSYTSATYKTNLISSLGSLGTGDTMDCDTLDGLRPLISMNNLQPWNLDGQDFYPLIINARQSTSLRQDSRWLSAQGQAGGVKLNNPIFNGVMGTWGNIVIFENDVVARLAYASGTTLDFMNYSAGADATTSGMFGKVQNVGTGQHAACALLLGKGAMSKAIDGIPSMNGKQGGGLQFTNESDDHGMVKEIGAMQFYGYARNDYYNEEIDGSTAATDQAEPQSAVVVTYAK